MGSFVIDASVKTEIDPSTGATKAVPDVDFVIEGAVLLLHLARGTPDEISWWAVNGVFVTQDNIDAEKVKGRVAFEADNPDLGNDLQKALDSTHKFAGEIRARNP